jgi:hypothetical protein
MDTRPAAPGRAAAGVLGQQVAVLALDFGDGCLQSVDQVSDKRRRQGGRIGAGSGVSVVGIGEGLGDVARKVFPLSPHYGRDRLIIDEYQLTSGRPYD